MTFVILWKTAPDVCSYRQVTFQLPKLNFLYVFYNVKFVVKIQNIRASILSLNFPYLQFYQGFEINKVLAYWSVYKIACMSDLISFYGLRNVQILKCSISYRYDEPFCVTSVLYFANFRPMKRFKKSEISCLSTSSRYLQTSAFIS